MSNSECCNYECNQGRTCPRQALAAKWRLKITDSPMVLIQGCSDPHMWYADRVGQLVLIERVSPDGLWAREPAGYINIIKFEDVES